MDQSHTGKGPKVSEVQVAQIVRAVATVFEDHRIDPTPTTFGEVVALTYEHTQLVGGVDEAYIKRLVALCKR
jgi:hypothetical protein